MRNTSPTVSVIITAFNREDLILRAIHSVLQQTYTDYEIILVDDASTDKTVEKVQSLNHPKITIIQNPKNRGIGGAKNIGIEAAQGKYIAFLDSDDSWTADKLEKHLEDFIPNALTMPLSFTAIYIHRQNGQQPLFRQPRKIKSWFQSLLYGETFSVGSTLLATKECFDKVGLFDESIPRMQDRDWSIRYFMVYDDFQFLPLALANIYNSGWPSIELVEKAIGKLLAINKSRLKKSDYNIFKSSLSFELIIAKYRTGKKFRSCLSIAKMALTNPGFFKYIAYRIGRKIKQKDAA